MRRLVPAVLLALAIPANASSVINEGPLASAETISIEDVLVGATLGLGGVKPATELFGRDFARCSRFKAALAAALSTRFTAAGIPVSATAKYSLQVGLFGGAVTDGTCGHKVFYLLVVTVWQPGEPRGYPERTVLGVVEDATLESAVTEAAVRTVDEFIAQRAASRRVAP